MDASKEIEMKKHVLGMLKNFMMGEEGSKFKPRSIEVEMMGAPEEDEVEDMPKGKAGLGDFLKDASESAPDMDDEDEVEPKKMSPKDFFKRK